MAANPLNPASDIGAGSFSSPGLAGIVSQPLGVALPANAFTYISGISEITARTGF
jgi:hypothetical protein